MEYTTGHNLYKVGYLWTTIEEYTYIQSLPQIPTEFILSLEDDEKAPFEQHLIANSDGLYDVISSEDLKADFFSTKLEAVDAKIAEVQGKFSQLTSLT